MTLIFVHLQLEVLEMESGAVEEIPLLAPCISDVPSGEMQEMQERPPSATVMHVLAVSPDGSMIAAGGANECDLGIYRLPTFEPLALCQVLLASLSLSTIEWWML